MPGPELGLSLFTNKKTIAMKAHPNYSPPQYYGSGDGDPDVVSREQTIENYSPIQFTVNSDKEADDGVEYEIFGPGVYTFVQNYGEFGLKACE